MKSIRRKFVEISIGFVATLLLVMLLAHLEQRRQATLDAQAACALKGGELVQRMETKARVCTKVTPL